MKQAAFFVTIAILLVAVTPSTAQRATQADGNPQGKHREAAAQEKQKFSADERKSSFFPIFLLKEEVYMEIPNRLQNRDFIVSSRVAEISSTSNKTKLVAGQMFYNPALFRFSVEGKQVLLLKPDTEAICEPNDPFYTAFKRNNIVPIQQVFDVEATTDTSVIINITKFVIEDLPYVEPLGDKMKPGKVIAKATKLLDVKTHPTNVEFLVRTAFEGTKEPFMATLQKSFVLLPQKPMMPRLNDDRISYYDEGKKLYSYSSQEVKKLAYIKRFNLQPKGGVTPKKGQPVEPEKPIIFYVDSAFPAAWKEGIKQGIEDWQPAFEAIGFKNAIIAKDYPENDPTFDPNDMRYNCVKLAVTELANAMGQHFIDPRSGEIIHAEVLFYSNVTSLLHKWYFLQTAAVNPDARKKVYDDETMKKLVRYLAVHEVGHCLGMIHNFRGSYAFNTEDLRSASFTEKYGTTASIMDYARFNYVAQPGDKGVGLFPPTLGMYDYHAIRMAYQPIPEAASPFDEVAVLRKWLLENETDPMYMHGRRSGASAIGTDPARQSADLGNDQVTSSTYGINNLKYILKHLREWMQDPTDDYRYITELYQDILKENFSYLSNAIPVIAGIYDYNAVANGKLPLYRLVDKKESIRAVEFICSQLLTQHEWLDSEYVRSFAGSQVENLIKEQQGLLEQLLDSQKSQIFRSSYLYNGDKNFITADEYLSHLTKHLFAKDAANIYHRNIQQTYLAKLKKLTTPQATEMPSARFYDVMLAPALEQELARIEQLLKARGGDWNTYLLKNYF